jgi:glycosyltransferase involved in cell wall biosynthesis
MRRNDVVYFEWASDLLAYATHFPKTCKIVTRLHRFEMFQWVPKVNWESVDRVILLSKAMQSKFNEEVPEHTHKSVVIPWAVSPDKYPIREFKFNGNIGTLCELIPRKRIYELILVFYQLVQHQEDLHLHIAGSTHPSYMDYHDAMQSLVKKLELDEKVTFYGRVENTSDWLRGMDIFVSNSYSEGLQSALIEAMASGCYCLSHHWDGADEILPEEYLFLTDKALYEKIAQYCCFTEEVKTQQSIIMRKIAFEKLDLEGSLRRVRQVIEGLGANSNSKSNTV